MPRGVEKYFKRGSRLRSPEGAVSRESINVVKKLGHLKVQMAVNDLRESANCRTSKLQQEALTMQESTSSVKTEWMVHMEKTESNYHEDTSAVESGKKDHAEVLEICLNKAEVGSQQWRNAQRTIHFVNPFPYCFMSRGEMEANQALRTRFSSSVSTTLEDAGIANTDINSSIDHSLQLDHEACGNLNSMITPWCGDLRELKGGHYHRIVEITKNAGKCLLNEYMVDEPSCSTPKEDSSIYPAFHQ